MNETNCDLSIFIPCLNEEENILLTILSVKETLKNFNFVHEIFIVDDNSKDNTYKVVEKYKTENPDYNIILIKNDYTKGIGRNYADISYLATGKYYMLVNGDNAETEETLIPILKELGKADMIIPYFAYDKRSLTRTIASKLFTFIVNFFSGFKVPYYNGVVLHKRINVMRWHSDTHGYAYQAELVVRLLSEGLNFKTVLVPWKNMQRSKGVSSAFTMKNFLSVSFSLLQILLRRLRIYLFYRNIRKK